MRWLVRESRSTRKASKNENRKASKKENRREYAR
jgi:hypothetical protein